MPDDDPWLQLLDDMVPLGCNRLFGRRTWYDDLPSVPGWRGDAARVVPCDYRPRTIWDSCASAPVTSLAAVQWHWPSVILRDYLPPILNCLTSAYVHL